MTQRRARRRAEEHAVPTLPIPFGPVSNGEFVPEPPSRLDHEMTRAALRLIDESAHRVAMDRRDFLQTAGSVAAVLAVCNLAACSGGGSRPTGSGSGTTRSSSSTSSTTTSQPGGTFTTPPTTEVVACEQALGTQGEFIVDVHGHHVMPDGPWRRTAPDTVGLVRNMLPEGCTAPDPLECANREAYLHDVFLQSDTTVAMLSDVPNSGPDDAPLPFDDAVGTQQLAATLTHGGAARVLVHNVIAPNVGDLQARLAGMEATAATGNVAAFKVYTAWSPNGQGYAIDDPAIGLPVVQKAHDLGVKILIAHKGLPLVSFDAAHNRPEDMVAVSRQFPDMDFVVFHAAWESRRTEGPYNPGATLGIDSFLAALDKYQVPPNDNVWADLGSVWRHLLTRPDQAAHMLGKLLSRVGSERVLWGTDAIWYGSPQPQIMAFRAFQITPEYQERFGYPALTDDVKRNVLGLNAARLFGLDPAATRCALASDPLAAAQPAVAGLHADGVLASSWLPRGPTTRREMLQHLAMPGTRWSPA